ncbi:endonuclease/exonuclease/phosphatase family protein [Plantactinospora sp. CA-294935]|uniref:endonuclease/exonuclease/phosphatase family protein n=1 Tax=Plantactinospora sp. CA-294935 TaxID=3240012 RepID=UPI003D9072BA
MTLGAALLGVLPATAPGVAGPPPATAPQSGVTAAAPTPLTVLHFNMRGIIRNEGAGGANIDPSRANVVDHVVAAINQHRPDVVSLNEACWTQVQMIREAVQGTNPLVGRFAYGDARDYQAFDAAPQYKVPGLDDQRCVQATGRTWPDTLAGGGMAILVRGPAAYDSEVYHEPAGGPGTHLGRAACVTARTPAVFRACVTHIAAADGGGVGQLAQVRAALRLDNPALPTVFVGDLNADPLEDHLVPVYSPQVAGGVTGYPPGDGYYYEADMCPGSTEPTHPCTAPIRDGEPTFQNGKIDYIFFNSANFDIRMSAATYSPAGQCAGRDCSDHRMLVGRATLALPGTPTALPPDGPGAQCPTMVFTHHDQPARVSVVGGRTTCSRASRLMQDFFLKLSEGTGSVDWAKPLRLDEWTCTQTPGPAQWYEGGRCVSDLGHTIEARTT